MIWWWRCYYYGTTMDSLPDTDSILMAGAIVLLAVLLWTGASIARGSFIDPLETVMFALVFAVFYFGGLQLLEGNSAESD